MKQPKNDSKYIWTTHAWEKMLQYGISEQRVKRIIRFPKRVEEGVLDGAIAGMQPSGKQEMWVMYVIVTNDLQQTTYNKKNSDEDNLEKNKKGEKKLDNMSQFLMNTGKRFKIITVWRYPGVSPVRDAIPDEVLAEIRGLI